MYYVFLSISIDSWRENAPSADFPGKCRHRGEGGGEGGGCLPVINTGFCAVYTKCQLWYSCSEFEVALSFKPVKSSC